MEKDTVPLRYTTSLLRVAEAQGYDLNELIDSLGLSAYVDINDRDAKVSAKAYSRIYLRVMWLLQDESFGLNIKQRAPGSFRMLCLFIIHCNTLEEAMNRAVEFNDFCYNLAGFTTSESKNVTRADDGTAEYRFATNNELLDAPEEDQLLSVAHSLAIWRRFCGWLIGKNLELVEVKFQAPEPDNRRNLDQLFKCSLSFNQPANSFRFPANYLHAPLIHTEESLNEFLRNAPYHLLASDEDDDTSIISQMKRIIGTDFSRDFPSVVDMAGHLNMSVRTLRRRLKDVGTTYQSFKDSLRKAAAVSYLNRPELKINAVSALLGFDEPSAFHRSFKKWTGMTPGEYRSNQRDMN